jgi:hypothetical protein
MADLDETRTAIADALTGVEELVVTAHPVTNNVRPGNGWVNLTRLVPEGFTGYLATFTVVIILSPDPVHADVRMDELAIPVMDAVLALGVSDASMEPISMVTDGSVTGVLYALQITFTTEVTN